MAGAEEFSYTGVGSTEHGALPAGYRHLRYRADVGPADCFPVAAEAVLSWGLHHAAHVPMRVSAPRAAPGVRAEAALGFGPARIVAPCRVVWAVDETDRAGFGYGTLAGHPVRGEEAFTVAVVDGRVRFSVTAFSAPAAWYARAAGSGLPWLQRGYAWNLARVLRRLCTEPLGAE